MNVLEKILEEIENHAIEFEVFGMCDDYVSVGWIKEIIRSHMDEVRDTNVGNKRLIDANALDEEVRDFFMSITGNPKQGTIVRECKESFRRMIDEQPTVYADDDWIPVEDGLPEEKTEVLCCFEDGTVQSLWQNWKNSGFSGYLDNGLKPTKVTAWRSFPEPYKPKKDKTAAGKEHIMSRFMKVE